ncbi:MAG: response regulator [Rhodoferax sp.]|nr:response regulator [Rhodoferax sp.]
MDSNKTTLPAPLKFLIVDDSRAIQAIVRRAIVGCGFEPLDIRTAADGEQALTLIENFVPDLIITDWHMPRVSGLELLQTLRQLGHKKMRLGFVTTERTPALMEQAVINGALFIVHKPFEDTELVSVVMAAVMDLVKPPEPEPEPPAIIVPGAHPVSTPQMQSLLAERFSNLPFRLIENQKMAREKLTLNNLLGLYGRAELRGVYAIGVMDSNAVCIIGGGCARQSPAEVRAAMAAGQPSEIMLSKATEFLRAVGPCLAANSNNPGAAVTLAKASIVKSSFARLSEVLSQSGNRSDFRLAIPGYGEGYMAFLVMVAP